MTVVLTSVTGFRNRGVEAIVVPTVVELLRRRPSERIAILTHSEAYDSSRITSGPVDIIQNDFQVAEQSSSIRARLRHGTRALMGHSVHGSNSRANALIRSASAVVPVGGDVFSSDYGNLFNHLRPLRYASQYDIPIVFLAHSIGPFHTTEEAEAWKSIAEQSKLITVRESLSYDYVVNTLGVPEHLVELTADPAFLLEPIDESSARRLLKAYGIDDARPVVAVSVSKGISRFAKVGSEEHFDAWCRVFTTLLEDVGAQILLVPHVQNTDIVNDDRIIATDLMRHFAYDSRIRLAGGDHSAAEYKGLIATCDMVLAERMHAALAGLSSGVCTVVVGYSVKAQGIMRDLCPPEDSPIDLVVPILDFISGRAEETAKLAWISRSSVEELLSNSLPKIIQRAQRNFDLLDGVINSTSRS